MNEERQPPGPRGGQFRHVRARLRDFPRFLDDLHRQYGGVVSYRLLNRRFVAVSDPAAIREVLVTKQRSFHKTIGYKDMRPMKNLTITSSDGEDHRRRRKLYQPSFGRKGMSAYAQIMVEKAHAVRENWHDGQVIDGAAVMHDLAMSVAVTAFFGRDMEVDPKIGQATVDGCIWDFTLRFFPFTRLLRVLPLPGNLRARRAWNAMDQVIYEVIRRARDRSQDRSDLISLLVRAEDEEGIDQVFSDDEVRGRGLRAAHGGPRHVFQRDDLLPRLHRAKSAGASSARAGNRRRHRDPAASSPATSGGCRTPPPFSRKYYGGLRRSTSWGGRPSKTASSAGTSFPGVRSCRRTSGCHTGIRTTSSAPRPSGRSDGWTTRRCAT